MKYRILLSLSSIALLSGCETLQTPQQRQQEAARRQAAQRQQEEQVYRVRGQVESVEMENARLLQEVQSLRNNVNSLNSQVAQLNSKMNTLDARQKKEMANLIKEVERLLKKTVASRPASSGTSSANRGPGREHVVEGGHTLSAIAQAYGTTVKAIKSANNLKSDSIYVGQKLFIPE
ncbi:LysM peptidoglycan-binding domain-containing protein [Pontiellaceae bacterium B12227]|nr:LysM peptidoglycan-binding domain-containing protein [Pontiellaceae bacterium B12227]